MSSPPVPDVAKFRQWFPAFANATVFPDAQIELYWDMGGDYLGQCGGALLRGGPFERARYLMAAHLLWIFYLTSKGQTPGVMTGATIDKVSVTIAAPTTKDSWHYWLAATPYGQALDALLKLKAAGGVTIPGNPERSAFRRVMGGSNSARLGFR